MNKLRSHLWSLAQEYARATAGILDVSYSDVYWIGVSEDGERGQISICDFGDTTVLSLDEMQVIVDNIDKWTARYGSTEAVGDEVRAWIDWWLEDMTPPYEHAHGNVIQQQRPRINLEHWLMGLREATPQENNFQELLWTKEAATYVSTLIGKFGDNRSLANVLSNLMAQIGPLEEKQRAIDRAAFKQLQRDIDGEMLEFI